MTREEFQLSLAIAETCRELDAELRRADAAFNDAKKSIAQRRREQQQKCPHLCATRACAEVAPQCDICGAEV